VLLRRPEPNIDTPRQRSLILGRHLYSALFLNIFFLVYIMLGGARDNERGTARKMTRGKGQERKNLKVIALE